jgi:hypothetical protein
MELLHLLISNLNVEKTGENTPNGKVESQMNFIEVLYFSFDIASHSSPSGKLIIIPLVFVFSSSFIL